MARPLLLFNSQPGHGAKSHRRAAPDKTIGSDTDSPI